MVQGPRARGPQPTGQRAQLAELEEVDASGMGPWRTPLGVLGSHGLLMALLCPLATHGPRRLKWG